jgi:hypothetical protein
MLLFAACAALFGFQACDTPSGTAWCRIVYQATDADGGAAPAPGLFPAGAMAKVASNPGGMRRADGKVFTGWADAAGNLYSVGKRFPLYADLVLFPRWKAISPSLLAGKKMFQATDLVDDTWYQVEAVKLVEGARCIVYADIHAFLTIEEDWGQKVVDEYERGTTGVYDKITGVFNYNYIADSPNTIKDVDGNGKVIFLLLDIQDGYTGSGGYVAGYFHSLHMYDPATWPNSNKADMLFMDVSPGTVNGAGGKTFYSTMAHELQHLINWSVTAAISDSNRNQDKVMETWIDEGLSLAAEYVYGGEDTGRVSYFNADPNETIVYGNNFFYWNIYGSTWDNDVLADYATAYLFFRWLGIHGGGNGIYTAILNSANSNYLAVTAAAGSIATSIDSSASADGKKWDALLGGWMRANMTGANTGYFGYKGKVSPAPRARYFVNTNRDTIQLFPGEGVFSRWSSGTFTGSGNIKYIPDIPIQGKSDKALLTWNGNTNIRGSKENGSLANTAAGGRTLGGPAVSGGGGAGALPASYPVGFRDLPGERARAGGRSAGAGMKK